jgi:peptide/nickel transport system substrate-binding protein
MTRPTQRSVFKGGALATTSFAPAALCHRSGRHPSVRHHRGAEDHQLQRPRRAAGAVNDSERVFFSSIWEALISKNWRGRLEAVPGLATEWRRIDDQTVELKLRQGVKFHNGDEMTAADVVVSFSRERMFAATEAKNRSTISAFEKIPSPRPGKELPPHCGRTSRPTAATLNWCQSTATASPRLRSGRPDARRPAPPAGVGAEAPIVVVLV